MRWIQESLLLQRKNVRIRNEGIAVMGIYFDPKSALWQPFRCVVIAWKWIKFFPLSIRSLCLSTGTPRANARERERAFSIFISLSVLRWRCVCWVLMCSASEAKRWKILWNNWLVIWLSFFPRFKPATHFLICALGVCGSGYPCGNADKRLVRHTFINNHSKLEKNSERERKRNSKKGNVKTKRKLFTFAPAARM